MAELKTLCIDGECMNNTDSKYTAGTNIVLSNGAFSVKDSPAFTGTPTAPTQGTASNSSTQIATTAFVQNAINRRLPKTLNAYSSLGNVTVSNNTSTDKAFSWTAPSGGLVFGTISGYWSANSTGWRFLGVTKDTELLVCYQRMNACSSGVTNMVIPFVTLIDSGMSIKARLQHNCGSSLVMNGLVLRAYFIPH